MDQMAENTPEVEIETDASEQIPDDVELAEEVETEDGSESSGNDAEEATETDDDESEQEFYFGDEKLDSPTSEDSAEHGLVKQGTITVSAEGLQVGDAFTIAGVNSVHQITKDTTGQPQVFRVLAVSGTTVTISPKILPPDNADVASRPYANVDANAASSAAITILNKNAAPANLFWADGSVELMYGKLAFPTGQGPQVMTATTEQGATLIMSYAFDHIKGVTTARFTTLYGCSVLVPEYTGIVIAGQ